MTLGEFIKVAQAFIRGEQIQYRDHGSSVWSDCRADYKFSEHDDARQFNIEECEYRIKPAVITPRIRYLVDNGFMELPFDNLHEAEAAAALCGGKVVQYREVV